MMERGHVPWFVMPPQPEEGTAVRHADGRAGRVMATRSVGGHVYFCRVLWTDGSQHEWIEVKHLTVLLPLTKGKFK